MRRSPLMWMTPVVFRHDFARESDDALDECGAPVTQSTSVSRRWCFEHDDVSALGVAESVGEAVGDHAVAEASFAVGDGLGAVKGWLHRGRGDAVRLCHLSLKRQDEGDGHGDSYAPVDDRPPRLRYPALRTIENSHGCTRIVRMGSVNVLVRHGAAPRQRSSVAAGSQGGLTVALCTDLRLDRLLEVAHRGSGLAHPSGND